MQSRKELYSDDRGVTEEEHAWLRSVVGSLSYYAEKTMYMIAAEVSIISQHLAKPTQGTLKATRRVLGYLAQPGVWDTVFWVNRTDRNVWTTYVDSDWAGEKDYGHTKSRTGVIILLNGLPIFWRSNKQPDTSLSSAQAEVYALTEAARDVSLRFWIVEELLLQVTWPAEILVDNSSGVVFQQSMNPASKLKGLFNLRSNWVKELQDKQRI